MCAVPYQTSFVWITCQHVLILFCSHAGLADKLLQKQQADYNEVIEKIFAEVSGLEDHLKILDPQVYTSVRVSDRSDYSPQYCLLKTTFKHVYISRNLQFHTSFFCNEVHILCNATKHFYTFPLS